MLQTLEDDSHRSPASSAPLGVGKAMWVTRVADPDGYDLFVESPTGALEASLMAEEQ